jgi:tetratricopeptide (TPR) repeat protein
LSSAAIDWRSALGVLAVGLAVGAFLFWWMRRAAAPAVPIAPSLDRRDLEARRDTLIRQLRELDDTASKWTPEQLARERMSLELAAAAVLRDLERQSPAPPSVAPGAVAAGAASSAAPGPDRSAMKGFLWGSLSATAIALVVFFASKAANPRAEGGSVTGTVGPMAGGGAAPMAGGGGGDIEAKLAEARDALGKQDMMGVWNSTQFVLQREPGNPVALSYQALVRLAMGQADVAERMLKQALGTAPDLLDGYLHLAVVYARTGRMAEAETTLRSAMSRFPEEKAGLQRLLEELRNMGPEDQVPQGDAHAGIAPPEAGGGAAPPPMMETAEAAPGTPARLSGVVEIDKGAQARAGSSGLVFVIVRAAGATSGPPLAVKRFPAGGLPGSFAITSADSMLGQELPDAVSIDARLDPDGDPLTRSDTDPHARLDNVKLGATGLRLVLK